jgi:hypothetical protein
MIESASAKHSFDECREMVKKSWVGTASLISVHTFLQLELMIQWKSKKKKKKDIKLDSGFKDFLQWARSQNVPVVIVSR